MLRRIHDPERGAGFVEYGAVILLVAAIAAAVITSGVSGRVQTFIASAIDSVEDGGGSAGDGGDGTPGEDATGEPGDSDTPGDGGDPGDPDGQEGVGSPAVDDDAPGGGEDGLPQVTPVNSPSDGQDEGNGWDDFWGGVGDGLSDIGDGIGNAATDAWDGAVDGWNGLVDGAQRLWDDPVQWGSDTWNGFTDGLSGTWDQVTTDPLGWVGDVLFSETVQENWNNGNRLEAGTQAVIENAIAFIPIVGWAKKGERIADIADGGGNDRGGDGDEASENETGGPPPDRNDEDDQDPNGNGSSCNRPSSFLPGTPVLLADGSSLAIEDITVGDEILAFDPLSGEEGPRDVIGRISSTGDKALVTLTVGDDLGAIGTVTATDGHPFWVPDRAAWVRAADLEPGTWLRTSSGEWTQVQTVTRRSAHDQTVHNLSVAGIHTYYVIVGDTPLLVHNDPNNNDCAHGENWAELDDSEGITHANSRHTRNGAEYRRGIDSVWNEGVNIGQLASATSGRTGTIQRGPGRNGGTVEFIIEADDFIGQLPDGTPTKTYTVIRDRWNGDLITTHPGLPERPGN